MATKRKAATKRGSTKKITSKKEDPKRKKAAKKPVSKGAEFKRRSEAARKNMVKWKKMGFTAYHGWSTSYRIKEILESQIEKEKREHVLVFVV